MNTVFIVLWEDPEDGEITAFTSYYNSIEDAKKSVEEDFKVIYDDMGEDISDFSWHQSEPDKWNFNDKIAGIYTIVELKEK